MHYIDIRITEPAERQFLQETLLSIVHGINASSEARLAVSFPDWEDAVFHEGRLLRPGNPGLRLRVFGATPELERLAAAPKVAIGSRMGELAVSAIALVPAAHGWVRFVRDRAYEKSKSPSVQRRRAQRAGVSLAELPNDRATPVQRPHHAYSYTSRTNGESFALRVLRARPEETLGHWAQAINAFGFAQGAGGVPAF